MSYLMQIITQEGQDINPTEGPVFTLDITDGAVLEECAPFTTVKFWGTAIMDTDQDNPSYTIMGRIRFDDFVFGISTVLDPRYDSGKTFTFKLTDTAGTHEIQYTYADLMV